MEKNVIREKLPERLDVAELEYDIKRLSAELIYHKSKVKIFEETIQAQQADLEIILDTRQFQVPEVSVYQ